MSNLIKANKCVAGEVYYLSGMWHETATSIPLINTPVRFLGKGSSSNVGKFWADHTGKHEFEFVKGAGEIIKSGDVMRAYSDDEFFIKSIRL